MGRFPAVFQLLVGALLGCASTRFPEKDPFGDPLPADARGRLGTVRFRHSGAVNSVLYSPTGEFIASAGDDGTVRVWNAATGKLVQLFCAESSVLCLARSPDGATLAAGTGNGWILLLQPLRGKELRRWQAHRGSVTAISFWRDGSRLASAAWDHDLAIWDVKTGAKEGTLTDKACFATSFACSQGGNQAAYIGLDGSLRIVDLQALREIDKVVGPPATSGQFLQVAFAQDFVAFSRGDHSVRSWELGNREGRQIVPPQKAAITSLALASDLLAVGLQDGTLQIHDITSGRERRSFKAHHDALTSIAFSSDRSSIASAGRDNLIRVWSTGDGTELVAGMGHEGEADGAAFSGDGRMLVSGGRDRTVRLWDVSTTRHLQILYSHDSEVSAVAFSKDGAYVASGGSRGTAVLHSLGAKRENITLTGHEDRVTDLIFLPQKTLASSGQDGTLRFWDSRGTEVHRIDDVKAPLTSLAISPNQDLLAGAQGQMARIWQIESRREVRRFHLAELTVSAAFSPDGGLLAVERQDGILELWEIASGEKVFTMKYDTYRHHHIALLPNGRIAASIREPKGNLVFWDTCTGLPRNEINVGTATTNRLVLSPDGSTLAQARTDTTILLWKSPEIREPLRSMALGQEQLGILWRELIGTDAKAAFHATCTLSSGGYEVVQFLAERLKRPKIDEAERSRLNEAIDRLTSEDSASQQKSLNSLRTAGLIGELMLKQRLERPCDEKLKLAIQHFLRAAEQSVDMTSGVTLGRLRALRALEHHGSSESRKLLEQLSRGSESSRERLIAQSALRRVAKSTKD